MNTKYILIVFGLFLIASAMLIYLMLIGELEYFIIQFKWFLRITIPFFIIYLFFSTKKNEYKNL